MTITLLATSFICLIALVLALYTGKMRLKHDVKVGDGGNDAVIRAMRAHANLIEFAPLSLIMIGFLEYFSVLAML